MNANPDQQVDPAALKLAAKGLNDTISELSSLGFVETAEVGRGFSAVNLSGLELGHAGLTSALQQFGDRWSWGVRALVHDGNEFAGRLDLAAGLSYDNDQYLSGTFKDVVADELGNPDIPDNQVEKESWQQVLHDNPVTQLEHPETSQAADQAYTHIGQTLQDAGKDELANNPVIQAAEFPTSGKAASTAEKWLTLLGTARHDDASDGRA